MKLNKSKLDALREYLLAGGSQEFEALSEQLSTEKQIVIDAYLKALADEFPEDFGSGETIEESKTYLLKDRTGIVTELELVSEKNGTILLGEKRLHEFVNVMISGRPLKVDLVELRELAPTDIRHGYLVGKLLTAAEVAKG